MKPLLSQLLDAKYLGDGAYIGHDGFQVWIIAHDGYRVTEAVALDEIASKGVVEYFKRLEEKNRGTR